MINTISTTKDMELNIVNNSLVLDSGKNLVLTIVNEALNTIKNEIYGFLDYGIDMKAFEEQRFDDLDNSIRSTVLAIEYVEQILDLTYTLDPLDKTKIMYKIIIETTDGTIIASQAIGG